MPNIVQPVLPTTVQRILKSLQSFLKTAANKSSQAVVSFLKNKFKLSDDQIKYFIFKSNQLLYRASQKAGTNRQQLATTFQKLPAWAKWGTNYIGYNPAERLQTESLFEKKKSEYKKLKNNQIPLTPEERKEVFKQGAVWHHSKDPNTGKKVKKISAVWKSKDENGKIIYVTATHRAYATAQSLSAIINKYHREIEPTA